MLNNGFYPTPSEVVDLMLAPFAKEVRGYYRRVLPFTSILEPSAGKGDICDHLVRTYDVPAQRINVIEIEPELQMVLHEKGYRLVDSDFLQYHDRHSYDLIIMNPPFADGAAHVLHAWELLHAGDLVALVNAATLSTGSNRDRKLLRTLVAEHGRSEYVGKVFSEAERKTNVEVSIVWLHKDADTSHTFSGAGMDFDQAVSDAEFSAAPLAHTNIIRALEAQYNRAAEIIIAEGKLQAEFLFYTKNVLDETYMTHDNTSGTKSTNDRLDILKQTFWRYIFNKTQIGRRTTSDFQRRFETFFKQTAALSFTEANVLRILEMFFLNQDSIMQECIVNTFDAATQFHEKNRVWLEGWKTNKAWKIAPKIIMPYGVEYTKWGTWSAPWRNRDFFSDMDKCLCYLSGRKYEEVYTTRQAIDARLQELSHGCLTRSEEPRHDLPFESLFFTINIFKKGTVHLKFQDPDLLAKFNMAAARGKNWLPDGDYSTASAKQEALL